MTTKDKLEKARASFRTAAQMGGDAAGACNQIGQGLSDLTEALMQICEDIENLKTAKSRPGRD